MLSTISPSDPLPLTLLFLLLTFAVCKHIFSPLRLIPSAHPTAPFSPAWILLQTFRDRRNRAVHAAHERLGDVVRVGPNEVCVNCAEGLRVVYAAGAGFEKSCWYDVFMNYGTRSLFTLLQTPAHSARKRLLSHIFSKTTISTSQSLASLSHSILLRRLIPLITSRQGTDIEIYEVFNFLTMDFITAYLFTAKHGTKFLLPEYADDGRRFLGWYQPRAQYFAWVSEMAGMVEFLKKWSWGIIRIVPKWVDEANEEIEGLCMRMCEACENDVSGKAEEEGEEEDCVYRRILKDSKISKLERASEMLDQIGAGYETTAVALTYATYALSLDPTLQTRLRVELRSLPPITTNLPLPSSKTLDALPLLSSITLETLRLHSPIPGAQPRLVPEAGCFIPTEETTYWLPANTIVSSQPHSIHRNPTVFPDAERFDPDRWMNPQRLEETVWREKEREMMRFWWAFGSGGRGCIGRFLAVYEFKMTLAAIYSRFKTKVVDDSGIEMEDCYTSGPVGNKLMVRYEPV